MRTKNHLLRTALLLAALSASCFPARANDSAIGDENGSIVFKRQPDISMDKESLFISEELIQVEYVFRNTGKSESVVTVAFPMPPMYFGPDPRNVIQDFKLWIDGVETKTQRKLVIRLEDKTDITAKVAALGWSEKELLRFLESQELPRGKRRLPPEWFGPDEEPLFTLSEYFTWRQAFPPGKAVSIRHAYAPSLSAGVPYTAASLIESYAESTCMDKDSQATLRRRDRRGAGVPWSHLRYILLTANNWQGPIKDFTLRIRKQSATDLVSLCFDDELRKVDPLTFEFHRKDYRPTRDLSILFTRRLED